ncbi:MAG: hypothetical protein LBJ31_08905 [Treponema sp.]|jgi:tetratricopeptide (TPR) repeat protein|nr:hypothetical protein [Treponema sp.]
MSHNIGKQKLIFTAALISAVAFSACQSLQQDKMYRSGGDNLGLLELEDLIVPLDKEAAAGAVAAARAKVVSLEKSGIKNSYFEGALAGWSGRLYIIEGNLRAARQQYTSAKKLAPGAASVRILEIRLETGSAKKKELCEKAIREAIAFEEEAGEFNIELGKLLLEEGSFREAVAAFDSAFPRLRPVYRGTYGNLRENAWALRNVEPGMNAGTAAIALKNEITWEEALNLSKNETDLLRFLGGRDSVPELFARLRELSIIPPIQNSASDPQYNDATTLTGTVRRSGSAWFLWHILAENRDRALLTHYSPRYPARSPIPDLERYSPFFDSIVGSVERQFMTLPDGKNFFPVLPVSGSDFLAMLKRLAAAVR